MHCSQCGTEVAEQAVFCQQCGARLGPPAAADAPRDAPNFPASEPKADGPTPPEKTLWEGSFSPKSLVDVALICGLITVTALFVGAFAVAAPPAWLIVGAVIAATWLYPLTTIVYQRLNLHYRLTNQRFFHERGILRRVTDRIEVIDMDDVSFAQGLIERFVGTGTITITSSDRTHPKLVLKGIDEVAKVAGLIDEARRAERLRRGVFIESV
jgi:membrane protein YdbS with pleckstrin-like domain